ncbi:MAG: hypothetical protein LBU64_12015 [Planctomycetota bacterium]|nr:hypothetical protein [Planctomycetota bacterium]
MAEYSNLPSVQENALAFKVAAKIRRFGWWLLLGLLVMLLAAGFVAWRRQVAHAREVEAENQVYRLEVELMSKPEAEAITAFRREARDFAGLPAGARALLANFAFSFNTRDFAGAEQAMRDFISGYPDNYLLPRAKLALAQSLIAQAKLSESEALLRELTRNLHPEVFPEAKLALAQTLEKIAEAAKGDSDEYRRRLTAAEEEYNDIVVRSQISIPSQRGFWPQIIVLAADFSLVVIRDRLAGYQHPEPGRIYPPTQAGEGNSSSAAEENNSPAEGEMVPSAPGGGDNPGRESAGGE